MIGLRTEVSLWAAALIAALAAVRWSSDLRVSDPVGDVIPSAPAAPKRAASDTIVVGARAVVAANPFRLARRPSAVPYASESEPGARSEQATPKPDLQLTGILGGPPWQAVLNGFPGHDGSVVAREGQTVEGFVICRITRDTVVVEGVDTTYVLTVRRAWR
jgi:hypothetical protein